MALKTRNTKKYTKRKVNRRTKKDIRKKNSKSRKTIEKRSRKSRKSRKIFKKINCSPSKESDYTCYSKKSLEKIKLLWNKKYPEKSITTNNPEKIWQQLKFNMENACNNEKCWLKQKFIANNLDYKLKDNTFAPPSPPSWRDNPNEWLNSNDIDKVMKQYEYKYPNFIFIGPSPIDFDKRKPYTQCVWSELCNFNLKNHIKNGINKIGIIYNTDPHYKDGSHWICMFIDLEKKFVYYFDSNADRTPKQIDIFADRVIKQANILGIKLKYLKNTVEHQKSNTECGMYTLYTIIQLLENRMTPKDFNKRISDKKMEDLRKILFN